jgi:hypothetical protein
MVAGADRHFHAASGCPAGSRQRLGPGAVYLQLVLTANPKSTSRSAEEARFHRLLASAFGAASRLGQISWSAC